MQYIFYFLLLFVIWLLATFKLSLPNLIIGFLVSFFTTLIFGRYFFKLKNAKKMFQVQRYFWAIFYLFLFAWECLKANLDVAYRVIHPKMPIKPGIVKVKVKLKTDIAKVFLANSITMTPGTLTVDIIGDEFFIHWIYVKSQDPDEYSRKISGRFEKYLKRIFE